MLNWITKKKIENEEIEFEMSVKKKKMTKNFLKENYDMDNEVKYWSDYSKLSYNDRSFTLINKYQNCNRQVMCRIYFDILPLGSYFQGVLQD